MLRKYAIASSLLFVPLLPAGRHKASGEDEVDDAGGDQCDTDRGDREQAPGFHLLLPAGSAFVRGQDQVVEQDQRARADHGHGAAEDGAEAHRHQQARHRQAGTCRDACDHRQEQAAAPTFCMNEEMKPTVLEMIGMMRVSVVPPT